MQTIAINLDPIIIYRNFVDVLTLQTWKCFTLLIALFKVKCMCDVFVIYGTLSRFCQSMHCWRNDAVCFYFQKLPIGRYCSDLICSWYMYMHKKLIRFKCPCRASHSSEWITLVNIVSKVSKFFANFYFCDHSGNKYHLNFILHRISICFCVGSHLLLASFMHHQKLRCVSPFMHHALLNFMITFFKFWHHCCFANYTYVFIVILC